MSMKCQGCYYYLCSECLLNLKQGGCTRYTAECLYCSDKAIAYYQEEQLCEECLMDRLEVEECTGATHYYLDGEYLGDSDNMEEVMNELVSCVEGIELIKD